MYTLQELIYFILQPPRFKVVSIECTEFTRKFESAPRVKDKRNYTRAGRETSGRVGSFTLDCIGIIITNWKARFRLSYN